MSEYMAMVWSCRRNKQDQSPQLIPKSNKHELRTKANWSVCDKDNYWLAYTVPHRQQETPRPTATSRNSPRLRRDVNVVVSRVDGLVGLPYAYDHFAEKITIPSYGLQINLINNLIIFITYSYLKKLDSKTEAVSICCPCPLQTSLMLYSLHYSNGAIDVVDIDDVCESVVKQSL